jgi:hypothetical protein
LPGISGVSHEILLTFPSSPAYLEFLQLRLGDGVSFGNDRNDVDLRVQLLHAHQIQRLQSMPCGADEVQADVDAAVVVGRQRAFDLQLLLKIRFELRVEMVDDSLERIILVDLVAISDSIADGQLQSDVALLQLVSLRLQLHRRQRVRACSRFKVGVEQRVHQRALTQARFAHAKNVEHKSILHALVDQLIGKTVESNMPGQLQVAQVILVLGGKRKRNWFIQLKFCLHHDTIRVAGALCIERSTESDEEDKRKVLLL